MKYKKYIESIYMQYRDQKMLTDSFFEGLRNNEYEFSEKIVAMKQKEHEHVSKIYPFLYYLFNLGRNNRFKDKSVVYIEKKEYKIELLHLIIKDKEELLETMKQLYGYRINTDDSEDLKKTLQSGKKSISFVKMEIKALRWILQKVEQEEL